MFCYSCSHVAGVPFPKNYLSTVKKILSRLYRVFVHVYIHHFDKLVGLGAVSSLNYDFSGQQVLFSQSIAGIFVKLSVNLHTLVGVKLLSASLFHISGSEFYLHHLVPQ